MQRTLLSAVFVAALALAAGPAVADDQQPAKPSAGAKPGKPGDHGNTADKGPLTGDEAGKIPVQAQEGDRSELRTGVIGETAPANNTPGTATGERDKPEKRIPANRSDQPGKSSQ